MKKLWKHTQRALETKKHNSEKCIKPKITKKKMTLRAYNSRKKTVIFASQTTATKTIQKMSKHTTILFIRARIEMNSFEQCLRVLFAHAYSLSMELSGQQLSLPLWLCVKINVKCNCLNEMTTKFKYFHWLDSSDNTKGRKYDAKREREKNYEKKNTMFNSLAVNQFGWSFFFFFLFSSVIP